jgi:Calcineurin-like phosphoesterase
VDLEEPCGERSSEVEMSTVWFTSDTHFFHKRILEFTDRPCDSVEEMNEALVRNWNKHVAKGDRVYHLGDFSFGTRSQTEEMIGRLRGQIHLIRGNHDDVLDRFADRLPHTRTTRNCESTVRSSSCFTFPSRAGTAPTMGHGTCTVIATGP